MSGIANVVDAAMAQDTNPSTTSPPDLLAHEQERVAVTLPRGDWKLVCLALNDALAVARRQTQAAASRPGGLTRTVAGSIVGLRLDLSLAVIVQAIGVVLPGPEDVPS